MRLQVRSLQPRDFPLSTAVQKRLRLWTSLIHQQKQEVVICCFVLSHRHGESATSVKGNNKTCTWFNEILCPMCGPRLHVERSDRGTQSTCTNERLIPRIEGCVPFYNDSWCTDPWHYSSSLIPRACVCVFCVCVALPDSQLTFRYWNGEYEMTKKTFVLVMSLN